MRAETAMTFNLLEKVQNAFSALSCNSFAVIVNLQTPLQAYGRQHNT